MIVGALVGFLIWFVIFSFVATSYLVEGYDVSVTGMSFFYAAGWTTAGALIGLLF